MSERRAIRVLDTIADIGTLLALAVAGVLCLVRMIWTMTVSARPAAGVSEQDAL
jgi:hypothetical protein